MTQSDLLDLFPAEQGRQKTLGHKHLVSALKVLMHDMQDGHSQEESRAALRKQLPPSVQDIFDRSCAQERTMHDGAQPVFSQHLLLRQGEECVLLGFAPYDVFVLAAWKAGEEPVVAGLPSYR